MDATDIKNVLDNLRKAKSAHTPYAWCLILEGSDREPCLYFEKSIAIAKQKGLKARKTARKKKMALGTMDYSTGKMVLQSDGTIPDNTILKALKQLVKAHGELQLLKKLRVNSTPAKESTVEPIVQEEPTPTPQTISDEAWKREWEEKYSLCKDLLKEALQTDAAKKDKVKNKLSTYKERLQKVRQSFKTAKKPYDEPTQQRLQSILDPLATSIFKMALKLDLTIPNEFIPQQNNNNGTHTDELEDNIMGSWIKETKKN